MNITCVCSECGHHEKEPSIEINFREGKIYWYCAECKKTNSINITPAQTGLPRTRLRR